MDVYEWTKKINAETWLELNGWNKVEASKRFTVYRKSWDESAEFILLYTDGTVHVLGKNIAEVVYDNLDAAEEYVIR